MVKGPIQIQKKPDRRLWAVGRAARYLGWEGDTLRKYGDLGQIPVYRLNGRRMFKIEDLDALIDRLPLWNDPPRDETHAGRAGASSQ
jgi:hypothetical protein